MMTVWSCTCAKCGKEVADGDRQGFEFKLAGWRYNRETHEWICDECAEKEDGAKAEGGAK